MESNNGGQPNQITGNVLFYNKPEPLNFAAHGKLGVQKIAEPFGFLRQAHAVPLTTAEFGIAATSFPIIFVGDDLTPVAVMGVRQGENLYVTDEGHTDPDYYVPAFVHRYPFVFAAEQNSDQLLLCIDSKAPMVTEGADITFFDGDQPSKFTQDAIEFCKEFERQRQGTIEFNALMKKHDLFEPKSISFQPRDAEGNTIGDPQKIADYMAVSEEKLNRLSAEAHTELRETRALGAIYAHLVSLLLWPRVINRALQRAVEQQKAAQS